MRNSRSKRACRSDLRGTSALTACDGIGRSDSGSDYQVTGWVGHRARGDGLINCAFNRDCLASEKTCSAGNCSDSRIPGF